MREKELRIQELEGRLQELQATPLEELRQQLATTQVCDDILRCTNYDIKCIMQC